MSDISISDTQHAGKDKIRVRLRERSSRLLSLLGWRHAAYAAKVTAPESVFPSNPESSHSLPAESEPASRHVPPVAHQTSHAHPPAIDIDRYSLAAPSKYPGDGQMQSPQESEVQFPPHQIDASGGMRRSQSTPEAITNIFSRKLSTTFGHPTVIRRAHLRSRPSICAVHFPMAPSSPLPVQRGSDPDSSNPSTPPSSNASPLGTQSTPPSSEEPPFSPEESKHASGSAVNSSPSLDPPAQVTSNTSTSLSGLPSASTSIVTVEATTNAKVFLETYFSTVYSGLDPRLQRRHELEEYIDSSSLTPDEKVKARKKWIIQEREYLRQCRVLKTRSRKAGNDKTVSMAGFEVLKILGRGSFGVVRLVKEKKADEQTSSSIEEELAPPTPEATTTRGSGRRRIMAGVKKDVFAMKVIRKSAMIRNCQEGHLRAERDFLVASARSRWIVPLIASFQDHSHLYLIMDYMVGGDFLSLLLRQCILREDIARWYVAEMVLCVEEAHRLRWIHRDIKPDNFLISASGHLKISDFGLAFDGHWAHDQMYYNDHRYSLAHKLGIRIHGDAQDQKEAQNIEQHTQRIQEGPQEDVQAMPSTGLLGWRDQHQLRRLARSVVGTSQYMAPEVIRGQAYDGRCDWWSVGIILYECLYGFTPFASNDRQKTKVKIHVSLPRQFLAHHQAHEEQHHLQTLRFPMHRPSDKLISSEAVNLINSLLQEKELRLSCAAYRHNDPPNPRSPPGYFFYHFSAFHQSHQGFYVYPNDAADIKAHPFFRGINWDVIHRSVPPFIPRVKGWEDTRYFDDWGNTQENDNNSLSDDGAEAEEHQLPVQENDDLPQNHDERPIPDEANPPEAAAKSPTRDRKGVGEKNRPRDKLLRDKRVGKAALEIRKQGAFLGYTYRRPKAVAMAFAPDRDQSGGD
ncbi:uncharacterized protein ATNIH1004_008674 [Aspergillus tanneri]|uniref:non-specific serine/threonine protein kinase n=1 Tax=Aspergillus tanneri TaxID=1220188 RepID=A0A5M9MG85_9EURO|nr:uncharacterized protein ATNIH1004_008674 [Aspergillus tanneri]KAA8644470.1 hypothetical protein ATNIH1004_008674 [Aspergillus tanneri]